MYLPFGFIAQTIVCAIISRQRKTKGLRIAKMYCTISVIGNRFLQLCFSDTHAFLHKTKIRRHKSVPSLRLAANSFFRRRSQGADGIGQSCIVCLVNYARAMCWWFGVVSPTPRNFPPTSIRCATQGQDVSLSCAIDDGLGIADAFCNKLLNLLTHPRGQLAEFIHAHP